MQPSECISWPARRWQLLRLGMFAVGLGLLLVAATFFVGGEWYQPPAGPAAALEAQPPASLRESVPARAQALQEEEQEPFDLASALGLIDPEALHAALLQATVAVVPSPTPTPTTPPPTPAPQPSAPPQQVAAPPASDPAPTPAPVVVAPSCPTAGMSAFALALFDAINSERVAQGVPALGEHGCVVYVAQLRSDDMASRGYFAHSSPEGESAFSLLDAYGVPYGWAGENLARNNYPDAETVAVAIRDLMASEPHRANILSTNYTHLGVAVAFDGVGMYYYTMVFIGPP